MGKFLDKLKKLANGETKKGSEYNVEEVKKQHEASGDYFPKTPIEQAPEILEPKPEPVKPEPEPKKVMRKWEFVATGYWHDDKKENFNTVVETLLSKGNRKKYANTQGKMRELVEDYGRIYKYNPFTTSQVELIKEDDNQYDSNAVAVSVLGKKIAYIKKEDTAIAREYIDEGKEFKARFKGGDYKAFDDEDRIKEFKGSYFLYIDVK